MQTLSKEHYKCRIRYLLLIGVCIGISLISSVRASTPTEPHLFHSDIFTFDNPTKAQGLHINMQGKTVGGNAWIVREAQNQDVGFLNALWADEKVMTHMMDGKPKDSMFVLNLLEKSSENLAAGLPTCHLTVSDVEQQPFMSVFTAPAEQPGEAMLAYLMMTSHQGQGYGRSVAKAILSDWAVEVQRIGNGIALDAEKFAPIIKTFQCFHGKPLSQMVAMARPANIASWKVLLGAGFRQDTKTLTPESTVVQVGLNELQWGHEINEYHLQHPLKFGEYYRVSTASNPHIHTLTWIEKFESPRFCFRYVLP